MSRQVRRVPLDFDHPLHEVWPGFVIPGSLREEPCRDCSNGYYPAAERINALWYGDAPFKPEDNGSTPYTSDTPVVRELAECSIERSPQFYGTGPIAVAREARRLASLFNSMWCHHLNQEDVDALVAGGRLWDFTRRFEPGTGWVDLNEPYRPTAAEVNEWSLRGSGHDATNQHVVVKARCEREDIVMECGTCRGQAFVESYPGQHAEADAWEPTPPPTGDGWQVWETVGEGSPVTEVFPTAEALAVQWAEMTGVAPDAALRWVREVGWSPSGASVS